MAEVALEWHPTGRPSPVAAAQCSVKPALFPAMITPLSSPHWTSQTARRIWKAAGPAELQSNYCRNIWVNLSEAEYLVFFDDEVHWTWENMFNNLKINNCSVTLTDVTNQFDYISSLKNQDFFSFKVQSKLLLSELRWAIINTITTCEMSPREV